MKLVKISLALVVAASAGVMTTLGLWAPRKRQRIGSTMSKAAPSYRRKAAWSTIQRSVKDMNGLVTGNCAPSAPERPEMLTGADPALDGPVIVFQDIIEVLHRSVLAVLLRNTLGF